MNRLTILGVIGLVLLCVLCTFCRAPAIEEDVRAAALACAEEVGLDPGLVAGARAEAIRAFLVDELGVAAGRVRIIDPVTLEDSQDDNWVRCRLDVESG